MTDEQREAQIREEAAHWHYHPYNDEMVLLRLLDAARAYGEQMQRERNEGYAKFHKAQDEVAEITAANAAWSAKCKNMMIEIARLQAPPGASAMERAREAWRSIQWSVQLTWPQSEVDKVLTVFARAIEQAEAAATEKERQRCATIDCIDLPRLLAEARAQALAERDQGGQGCPE